MNTLLEKLFEKYNFSKKDKYEINQIFLFLSNDKKERLLNNFDILAEKVMKIEKESIIEQEILLDKLLIDIKNISN